MMSLLKTDTGRKLISIILGLGLVSLFRKVCNSDKCLVIKGPKISDVSKSIYKIDEECYTYEPIATICKS
jgi:hypothetical protein